MHKHTHTHTHTKQKKHAVVHTHTHTHTHIVADTHTYKPHTLTLPSVQFQPNTTTKRLTLQKSLSLQPPAYHSQGTDPTLAVHHKQQIAIRGWIKPWHTCACFQSKATDEHLPSHLCLKISEYKHTPMHTHTHTCSQTHAHIHTHTRMLTHTQHTTITITHIKPDQ